MQRQTGGAWFPALVVLAIPVACMGATTFDMSAGPVVVSTNGEYIVTGASTVNTIKVEANVAANITLQDVSIKIDAYNSCAFSISNSAMVNLTLLGSNTLASEMWNAGLRVPEGATLTITSNSSGSLLARYGETNNYFNSGGAGIGGNDHESGGTITIDGGTVIAMGGFSCAGIGGGSFGSGGTITINGGTVMATGGYFGAGIGGGSSGSGGTITINGGMVTAVGEQYGTGIGGGGDSSLCMECYGGAVGLITIRGGTVTATGIGGSSSGAGGAINILGGSVKANIQWSPTDGYGHELHLVQLTNAVAEDGTDDAVVEIQITNVAPAYVYRYAGSGHGSSTNEDADLYFYLPAEATYPIAVGTNLFTRTVEYPVAGVAVDGLDVGGGAGIGWRYDGTILSIFSNRTYSISGTSDRIQIIVSNGVVADIYMQDLNLHAGGTFACAFLVASNAAVNLVLLGSNTLSSGQGCAGLQVPESAMLTISGEGTLSTSGGSVSGAGIGGGRGSSAGTIKIDGGTVTATGGFFGAGIGGGGSSYFGGSSGTITINGGIVTATGGEFGSGIGYGGMFRMSPGGTITINGGTVIATGGYGIAGIDGTEGILITATGASVKAGADAASAVRVEQYSGEDYAYIHFFPEIASVQATSGDLSLSLDMKSYTGYTIEGADCSLLESGAWDWQTITNFVVNPDGSINIPMDADASKIIRARLSK
jgi:hypothetical protein